MSKAYNIATSFLAYQNTFTDYPNQLNIGTANVTTLNADNVGIANDTPTKRLDIKASHGDGIFLTDTSFSAASPKLQIIGKRSDDNFSASFSGKINLAKNNTSDKLGSSVALGQIAFGGNHTNSSEDNIAYSASIVARSSGPFNSASDQPTDLVFYTGNVGVNPDTANIHVGTERMRINSVGIVTTPNIPAFYGSDLSPNTAGRFPRANVILVNKGSHITHVSPDGNERTRFNAPVTGLYYAWMGNIGTNAGGTLRMHFYINGTSQYPQLRNAQTTNHGTSASMVGIFEMNAGDYLEWYSYDQYGWYNSIYAHIGCYLIG